MSASISVEKVSKAETVPAQPEDFFQLVGYIQEFPLKNNKKSIENSGECEAVDPSRTMLKDSHCVRRADRDLMIEGPNQKTIASNYKFLSDDLLNKHQIDYFIFEIDDLRHIEKCKLEECMMNYKLFMKSHPNKQIYIRNIITERVARVFVGDV